jgi:hypothetical protein
MECHLITEDQLVPNCVINTHLSLPVATSVVLLHVVHVFQLLHSQHSLCTEMQALDASCRYTSSLCAHHANVCGLSTPGLLVLDLTHTAGAIKCFLSTAGGTFIGGKATGA